MFALVEHSSMSTQEKKFVLSMVQSAIGHNSADKISFVTERGDFKVLNSEIVLGLDCNREII